MRSVLAATFAALGLLACLQVVALPPPPPDAPTLEVFRGEAPPVLEPTDTKGFFAAPALGPTVFYDEEKDYWYRYAKNRWYMAFVWDGNWFDLPEKEVPAWLAERYKPPPPKPVEDELAELERQLKELEAAERDEP